jgi:hypothetical protein
VKLLFAVLLTALIAACTTQGGTASAVPYVTMLDVETAYNAAVKAEITYLQLPTCGASAATTALCATPEKRAQIKAFDQQAYTDLQAARAAYAASTPTTAATLATADQSVKKFDAAIPK